MVKILHFANAIDGEIRGLERSLALCKSQFEGVEATTVAVENLSKVPDSELGRTSYDFIALDFDKDLFVRRHVELIKRYFPKAEIIGYSNGWTEKEKGDLMKDLGIRFASGSPAAIFDYVRRRK